MRGYPDSPEVRQRARDLRAQGLTYREIGEQLDRTLKTIFHWCDDPDGAKKRARFAQWDGKCIDCGGRTSGCDGPGTAPERCIDCFNRLRHDDAVGRVLAAIQKWADEHGGIPPNAADWNVAQARALGHYDRVSEFEHGDWPATTEVRRLFGSWNAGIEAAGFEPTLIGHYGRAGEDMDFCRDIRKRYEAGESSTALAREIGVAQQTIAYRIRKAGGSMRSRKSEEQGE